MSKDILDTPLQMFSEKDSWTLRNAYEGAFITGSPGSGKTARIAANAVRTSPRKNLGRSNDIINSRTRKPFLRQGRKTERKVQP